MIRFAITCIPFALACGVAVTTFDRLADPSRGVYYAACALVVAVGYIIVDSYALHRRR